MEIDINNKFLQKVTNDNRGSYIDFNWKLFSKMHNSDIVPALQSTLDEIDALNLDIQIRNRSRESKPCYSILLKIGRNLVCLWISFSFKYYVVFRPFGGHRCDPRGFSIEIVDQIKQIVESNWPNYSHINFYEIDSINPFPVGYMVKESTICEVLFGSKLGDL